MAVTSDRPQTGRRRLRPRLPRLPRRPRGPLPARVRTALAILIVVAIGFGGGLAALASFSADRSLSVGTINLSVKPGHRGSLDVYVPLVDWGARFMAVRLPARLTVEVKAVNRSEVARLAGGQPVDVNAVRTQARNAIASYIRVLVAIVFAASLAVGLLAGFAVRARTGPRLRFTLPAALVAPVLWLVALVVLLPPRGQIDNPQYFAHGPDIPRALQAVENATTSSSHLSQELNAQLVGLARLVERPGERRPLGALPRFTLASDLHNNVLALPALESAADGGPLFFPGDLTDSGSPFETRLVRRVVSGGHPFVFVSGNHDSDVLTHQLVAEGAIVLTQRGRLEPHGHYGPLIADVAGLRVAGYSDPYMRFRSQGFQAAGNPVPTQQQQAAFWKWLQPLVGHIDMVMVHEPALAALALAQLQAHPPARPLAFLVGHTHHGELDTSRNVVVLNGGTIGAGGTGNLAEHSKLGLARLTYSLRGHFDPLAADLVQIDPNDGSATAERRRIDVGSTTPTKDVLSP